MNFLVIDTTRKEAVLELYFKGVNFSQTITATQKHNETLLNNIENLLATAKAKLTDLSALACVTGPGSFTGIRVGMATTSALSLALNVPILSGNVFEILSAYVGNGTILLHSTSSSYYYVKIEKNKIKSFGVVNYDEIEEFLKNCDKVFCLQSEQELMSFSYNNLETIKNYNYLLYQFFKNQMDKKNFTKTHNFEPFYIQLSQAERELKNSKKEK